MSHILVKWSRGEVSRIHPLAPQKNLCDLCVLSEAGGEKVIEITSSNPTVQVEFIGGPARRLELILGAGLRLNLAVGFDMKLLCLDH